MAFRFNSTAFLLAAEEQSTINIECASGKRVATDVEGLVLVALADNCEAFTDNFRFHAMRGHLPNDLQVVVAAPSLEERFREPQPNATVEGWEDASPELQLAEQELSAAADGESTPVREVKSIITFLFVVLVGTISITGVLFHFYKWRASHHRRLSGRVREEIERTEDRKERAAAYKDNCVTINQLYYEAASDDLTRPPPHFASPRLGSRQNELHPGPEKQMACRRMGSHTIGDEGRHGVCREDQHRLHHPEAVQAAASSTRPPPVQACDGEEDSISASVPREERALVGYFFSPEENTNAGHPIAGCLTQEEDPSVGYPNAGYSSSPDDWRRLCSADGGGD